MGIIKKWFYDYENKCDCSEDDKCGCSYPNNMNHNFDYVTEITETSTQPEIMQSRVYVGSSALNFVAPAVMPDNSINNEFDLFDYMNDSYGLLLFYPADFLTAYPSEIMDFNRAYNRLADNNVKLIIVSVDSLQSYFAWKKMLTSKDKVGNINYPLVSDIRKAISFNYGTLRPNGISQHSAYIIDNNHILRYQVTFDKHIKCDVSELMRIIDELRKSDVCEVESCEQSQLNINPQSFNAQNTSVQSSAN